MSRFDRRVRRGKLAKLARKKIRDREDSTARLRLSEAMHAVDQAVTIGRSMAQGHKRQKER